MMMMMMIMMMMVRVCSSPGLPDAGQKVFGERMRLSLVSLLHGAVREDKRDWALRVLADMIEVAGESWAIEPSSSSSSSIVGGFSRGTSASLFVNILTTEIRMGLEEATAVWEVPPEETSLTDAIRRKRLDRINTMVVVCIGAVESILRFLCGVREGAEGLGGGVEGEERWESLPGSMLLRMRDGFHDTITILVRFIKEGELLLREGLPSDEASTTLIPLIRASVRLVGVYLAEDEEALSNSTATEMMSIAMRLTIGHGDEEEDITPFLFPIMNKLISDGGGVVALVEKDVHVVLVKYLMSHLATLQHPRRICEAMMILHDMMVTGAQLPCSDQSVLLCEHPALWDLIPLIPPSAQMALSQKDKEYKRLARYMIWFVVDTLKLLPVEAIQSRFPPSGASQKALMIVVDSLLSTKHAQGSEEEMSEEEFEELTMLNTWIKEGLHECKGLIH